MKTTYLVVALVASAVLVSACAVPIRSVTDDGVKKLEGIQYFLTSSQVVVTVRARLESCDRPEVLILKPTILANPVADETSAYLINPRDAWNLFRAIDVADIALTADRRLSSASAKVTDKTVETLGDLIKNVAAVGGSFADVVAQPKPAISCSESASRLSAARDKAERELTDLVERRTLLLSTAVAAIGFGQTMAALDAAIVAQKSLIDDLKSKLTKTIQVQLQPKSVEPIIADRAVIDMTHGWFGVRTDSTACKKDALVWAADCLIVEVSLKADCPKSEANRCGTDEQLKTAFPKWVSEQLAMFGSPYDGLLYRIPAYASATLTLARSLSLGAAGELTVRLESGIPDQQSSFKVPEALEAGTQQKLALAPVLVAQWGRMGAVPSDVGYLTNNSVKVSFDEWGVPKGVNYAASPVTIPALIGLVSQADSAFNPKAPPADPYAGSRAALLQQLLQYCLDAPATNVPSYCSGILK